MVWFYEDLAGIKSDTVQVGFKKIIMKPHPIEGLDHVTASYHSVYGLIKSKWKSRDNNFDWEITIPANTTAKVYIPAKSVDDITENGKDMNNTKGVKYIGMEGNDALLEIGSGKYHFKSKNYK